MQFVPYLHKVQYYETDTMKIVHHSNYIRWMEEARCDMLEQMGLGYDKMEEAGVLSPVLSAACEYKGMTRFGESVYILPVLESYTGVRFEISYEIRGTDGSLRATGKTSHCFLMNGAPVSIKRKFPAWDKIFRETAKQAR